LLTLERKIQRWRDEASYPLIVHSIYGMRRMFRAVMQYFCLGRIVESMKRTGAIADPGELFRLASRGWYGIIAPIQSRDEFLSLLHTVGIAKPAGVLEIGTASGGTLFMFTRVVAETAKIASVDLPQGSFGGGYAARKIPLYSAFALPRQQLKLIRADSHSPHTYEQVKAYFSGQSVDFLFIDGDHTYEGVRKDFEMYRRLVGRGGHIAFHDIVYAEGVARFWAEIKPQYKTSWELVSPHSPRYGIGVLQVNSDD
jgi:cephalosporin hydroxylase